MPYKPTFHASQQQPQQEQPWLRYPGTQKTPNGHSRSFAPAAARKSQGSGVFDQLSQQHHQQKDQRVLRSDVSPSLGLKHRRSSSKLGSTSSGISSTSLPISLVGSNSSSDSLGHHSHPQPFTPHTNKPKTLSDELSFAFQITGDEANARSRTVYPSPITPSDILSIPDLSASSSASSSSSSSASASPTTVPLQRSGAVSPIQRSNSTGHKLRPSPLSINTGFGSNSSAHGLDGSLFLSRPSDMSPGSPSANLADAAGVLRTPPLTRHSHSEGHSSASNSSYSNASSPSSATAPCSALCQHPPSREHRHHSHHHSHHHSSHQHHHHRNGHHCKQDRHTHHRSHRQQHHPSCHYHKPTLPHGAKSDRISTLRSDESQLILEQAIDHGGGLNASSAEQKGGATAPLLDQTVAPASAMTSSTAVTIVDSTPAFGVSAHRLCEHEDDSNAFGLFSAEPPKKRQRSAAAMLFGAAFETVIFTSAVALSAYQLLTGKGRQVLDEDDTMASPDVDANMTEANLHTSPKPVLQIESTAMDIPTRRVRHRDTGLLGKSLHHNSHMHHHRSRKSRSSVKNRHGNGLLLSTSLPHAYEYDHGLLGDQAMTLLPGRPNTGTEDNDEQFLRMEARLSSLIAEGKRALNSRIQDWAEESSKE
ncbi:hypothetical protein KVV02_007695 [Mortierella alpina]|uniref:Uncharacterized protein n=1 Tax=Mortierella alpina TaxID=64518 RepID=A0A9P8CVF8_MORAP|nr:hypothetical protein KVV02_007695 [Mortierella alpina]